MILFINQHQWRDHELTLVGHLVFLKFSLPWYTRILGDYVGDVFSTNCTRERSKPYPWWNIPQKKLTRYLAVGLLIPTLGSSLVGYDPAPLCHQQNKHGQMLNLGDVHRSHRSSKFRGATATHETTGLNVLLPIWEIVFVPGSLACHGVSPVSCWLLSLDHCWKSLIAINHIMYDPSFF